MNRQERIAAHDVPGIWLPRPVEHLYNSRDAKHFRWTMDQLKDLPLASILDIGNWDGWIDFLLSDQGFKVHGVELIPNLCQSSIEYARINNYPHYKVYQGFFDEVDIRERYEVVLAYEVLEHVSLDAVPYYLAKMEKIASRRILISLPDQDMNENPQHCWTPSEPLIANLLAGRKYTLERVTYPGADVPANFLIKYDTLS